MDVATDKVFEKLCANVRANGPGATMTRADLQKATGLSEQDLRDVLVKLGGATGDQNLQVRFVGRNPDKITLGASREQKCGVK